MGHYFASHSGRQQIAIEPEVILFRLQRRRGGGEQVKMGSSKSGCHSRRPALLTGKLRLRPSQCPLHAHILNNVPAFVTQFPRL